MKFVSPISQFFAKVEQSIGAALTGVVPKNIKVVSIAIAAIEK